MSSSSTHSPFFQSSQVIAADNGGQMLLKAAKIGQDAGVVNASTKDPPVRPGKFPFQTLALPSLRKGGDRSQRRKQVESEVREG